MRAEYVIVGFILVLIVLIVSLSMLSGVIPNFMAVFNTTAGAR